MKSKVSIVKCKSYNTALVSDAVKRSIELIGGITAFIKPNSKVLIKPNLLMAKPPECGITTHPEVVRAVVRILKSISCRVVIGDGPSVWGNYIQNVGEVYRVTGVENICRQEGAELVNFDKRKWKGKFPLTSWIDECDHIINLPKFKTHDLTLLTAAVKNLFGTVVGTYKTELHKTYFDNAAFANMLVDIFEQVKPCLTVVDAILAMEGDGPATGGKLRSPGIILASSDCVALDSILAHVMGIMPEDILTTKEAAIRGLGVSRISSIILAGEKLEDVTSKPFTLPSTSLQKKIPPQLAKLAKSLIKYYPYVKRKNCILCSGCVDACPNGAVSLKNAGIVFDYKKCIACFCCQEACPSSAIKVKKSLFAKLIGL